MPGASVSVVIATVGSDDRAGRLNAVLAALARIAELDEIVIVWQGDPHSPRLPAGDKVRVVISAVRAASHARNLGASSSEGAWLWFLDDDTIPVGDDYIRRAFADLERCACQFGVANVRTSGDVRVVRAVSEDLVLSRRNLPGNFWEPGLFIPRDLFLAHRYDERLGPGRRLGSSEGLDLGLRLLDGGARGVRAADLVLDHPPIVIDGTFAAKVGAYARGNGYVSFHHGLYGHYAADVARAAAKVALNAARLRWREMNWAARRLSGLLAGPFIRPEKADRTLR
jgi:hypothetical protein